MSKRDAAFLPKCSANGCETHAPIVEHGKNLCCKCYLESKGRFLKTEVTVQ
jgi:hypothetical protein